MKTFRDKMSNAFGAILDTDMLISRLRNYHPQINENTRIFLTEEARYVYYTSFLLDVKETTEVSYVPKPGLLNRFFRVTDELDNIPLHLNQGYEIITKTNEISEDELIIPTEHTISMNHIYLTDLTGDVMYLTFGYNAEEDMLILQDWN